MRRILLALAFAALASGSAAATEQSGVMASIRHFLSGINTGNLQTAVAVCAPKVSILDEVPPHEWQGASACADWASAYASYNKQQGITDGVVTLGTPRHLDVAGDRAYVVVPATYTYKQHGKPATEKNASLTLALQKIAAEWRITGWAWSAP